MLSIFIGSLVIDQNMQNIVLIYNQKNILPTKILR